jgi:heme A synthase
VLKLLLLFFCSPSLDRLTGITPKASVHGAGPGIAQWLNLEAIQLLTHHTSGVIAAVVFFWVVGWMVRKLVHDSAMKRAVLLLDEVVLVCIFAYFAYELLFLLYLRTHSIVSS